MNEELENEIRRRLALPQDEWQIFGSTEEFRAHARSFLQQRLAGPFITLDEGERRTAAMIARKRAERGLDQG